MIDISIIMPVYNAEKTLYKSIESIISQTFQDWELIIIDDGSTDSSYEICDYYAKIDNRIKIFHKVNEGVAIARQWGINKACGKYSIHVDTDDWIETNMLEELYNVAKEYNSDIVISDYYINKNNSEKITKQIPSGLNSEDVLSDLFNNRLLGSLWNKLIRTDLYKKYNVNFFKGINYCEDLLVLIQLLQHKEIKISYCPQAFYHYSFNPDSITRNYTYETYNTRLKFRDKLEEVLQCSDYESILENVSFGIFIEALIFNILSKNEIKEGLKKYRNNISKIKTPSWKIGFLFLKIGLHSLSRKLIHF